MGERMFYRVTEVAELIGCSRTTIYSLVAAGEIPTVRIGGMLRVPAEAVRKLGQANKEKEEQDRPAR